MKRLLLVFTFCLLHFALILPVHAQDSLSQTVSSLSGRITASYPDGWVASSAVQTDVQSLYASEALTIAQDQATLDAVKLGPPIGGSHLVFVMFPTLQVFPLNPNPQDFNEVIQFVFRENPVEQFEVSGYPAAQARQPGGISFTMIGLGPAILTISAEGKTDADAGLVDSIIQSVQISVPQDRFSPEKLRHTVTTPDGRVSFAAGEGWYFGTQGGVAYTTALASPVQDFFAPGGLMEIVPLESPLFAVLPHSYADFFEPGQSPSQSDLQVVLITSLGELGAGTQGEFSPLEVAGFPALQVNVSIGENIGQAVAVDAVHTVYVFVMLYAGGDYAALLDALWNSVAIQPLAPEIAALPPEGLREGFRAPNFEATLLDGTSISLRDLRGAVVMINFWFTTCPPCRIEMPAMQQAYADFQARGFTILAVNNREVAQQITPFMNELGLAFPVVLDLSGKIQQQYGIWNYPTSIFVDRDGVILGVNFGAISEEQMRAYIETGLTR